MKFKLVKYSELNRLKFDESSTWAQYYEPGDIDILASIGFDKKLVTEALEAVGWSDEYWFPVPDETEFGTFAFEYRKANFETTSGVKVEGYVVDEGHCICLFGNRGAWTINLSLLDLVEKELKDLKEDIGIEQSDRLLPLLVTIPFKKIMFNFGDIDSEG